MKLTHAIAIVGIIVASQSVVPASARTHHRYLPLDRDAYVATRQCETGDFFSRLFGFYRDDCTVIETPRSYLPTEPTRTIQITGLNGI